MRSPKFKSRFANQVLASLLLLLGFSFCFFGVTTHAQSLLNNSGSSSQLPQVQAVDKQAEVVESKQQSASDLRQQIAKYKQENDSLDKEILVLQKKQTELESRIDQLNTLSKEKSLPATGKTDSTSVGGPDIDQQIKDSKSELLQVQSDLAIKTSQKKANDEYIQKADTQLNDKSQEAQIEANNLQSQLWNLIAKVGGYVLLLIFYFLTFQGINTLSNKFVSNELARKIIQAANLILYLTANSLTILVAFIGNLSYLLTGLGVLSAALVLALQDFVSSFFAWLMIRMKSQYHTRDVIKITTTSQGQITGVVTEIGIFRTNLRELAGSSDEINSERPTGRNLSFPNNLILKEAVINFSKENRILWHSMDVVITFESNVEKAQKILNDICKEQFEYALDHKDEFLDEAFNLKYIYKPKIYLSIAGSGPKFTIWFACRYGKYREVLETYSRKILTQFPTYGIDIAYNTNRIISSHRVDEDPHTTFHNVPVPLDILG